MKGILGLFLLHLALYVNVNAASFYVSVNGTSSGIGTATHPWDLQTALNHPTDIQPGDTIWIFGGIYQGVYSSSLRGVEGNPIIVRSVPGETVVLDGDGQQDANGVLSILGQYTWYWGLTITNSDSSGANSGMDGVYFLGANNKLINCYIFNNGVNGVGFWRPAVNSEIYGCIIYHNGFKGPNRGHGHGIYAQNETGTKMIRDNILFNSFGIGIHIYTEQGGIQGFIIDGNVIFNSGIPGGDFIERNILVGGLQPADHISIRNNIIYNRPDYHAKASVQLGYGVTNRNAEFTNNTMIDGSLYAIKGWNSLQVTGNSIYSRSRLIPLIAFDNFDLIRTPVFNHNEYVVGSLNYDSFNKWQSDKGVDQNSTFYSSVPAETSYQVSSNRYETGRGRVIVYNWGGDEYVSVNLSSVLNEGDEFQVFDVLNLSAPPIISGVYTGGTVQLPLTLTDIELPIREDSNRDVLEHTLPQFGVFVVQPILGDVLSNGQSVSEEVPIKIYKCYPNPTVDILAVDFYSPQRAMITAEVYNEGGQMVYNELYGASFGDNSLVLNIAHLPGGMYIVTVANEYQKVSCKVLKRDFALDMDYEVEDIDIAED